MQIVKDIWFIVCHKMKVRKGSSPAQSKIQIFSDKYFGKKKIGT